MCASTFTKPLKHLNRADTEYPNSHLSPKQMNSQLHHQLTSIGSLKLAAEILTRSIREVPAYSALRNSSGTVVTDLAAAPITDKLTYITKFPLRDRMGGDSDRAFALIASSGSSGQAVFWPQLRTENQNDVADFVRFLEQGFEVHRKRTLVIVGLALGSWIGGDMFSWSLKNVALSVKYPLCVLTTGSRHEEILNVLKAADSYADQILLVVCPSAIGHLHLLAESLGIQIPHHKMRYLVLGEPFPESLRTHLRSLQNTTASCPALSVYGSADTGLLGAESVASAAVRGILADDQELGTRLGLPGPPPHLFHCSAQDAYLEDINGELIVTRWQGVPLVRYNLHDRVKLFSWLRLRDAVLQHAKPSPLRKVLAESPSALPDIIAIDGRTDRCVMLCGTNISESMLDEAIRRVAASPALLLSGHYQAWMMLQNGRQRLGIALETTSSDPSIDSLIYQRLVAEIGRVQPEFLDDWHNVYKRWDESTENRILSLTYVPWPTISSKPDGTIKARGILRLPPDYVARGDSL